MSISFQLSAFSYQTSDARHQTLDLIGLESIVYSLKSDSER